MGVFPFDSGLFFLDPTFVIPKAFFRLIRQDVFFPPSVTLLLQKIPRIYLTRSHPKTCFRSENEQFCRLAMSENDVYLENILSLSEAARSSLRSHFGGVGRQKGRSQQKLGFWDGFHRLFWFFTRSLV